jgi:hypothetical protein
MSKVSPASNAMSTPSASSLRSGEMPCQKLTMAGHTRGCDDAEGRVFGLLLPVFARAIGLAMVDSSIAERGSSEHSPQRHKGHKENLIATKAADRLCHFDEDGGRGEIPLQPDAGC